MAIIGIDFGNKFSCVAVNRANQGVEIILNDHGNRVTPSFLTFTDEGRLIGEEAREKSEKHSESFVYDIKRFLGKKYVSVCDQVNKWPFRVVDADGEAMIKVKCAGIERRLAPEELAGMFLHAIRINTESQLGIPVDGVVLSIPAHATNAQRHATVRAAALAGLRVVKLLNAPTAAALAHSLVKRPKSEQKVLVYDLGGHALDVSILTIDSRSNIVVKSTAVAKLGGDDFDEKLAQYFADEFEKTTGLVLEGDHKAFKRLKEAAEKAKKALSFVTEVGVSIGSLRSGIDLHVKLTRPQFETIAAELFARSLEPVERALQDARMAPSSVNSVVLVGGTTKVPRIQNTLRELFGDKVDLSMNPDEAVARGTAILAADSDIRIKDICPRAFSVAARGGLAAVLIPRLSLLPLQRGRAFSTCGEGAIRIKVLEGDKPRVADNEEIGDYELKDFSANKLHLLFNLDDDGILSMTASDNRRNPIVLVNANSMLVEERSSRMLAAAERYRVEDDELRIRALTKNQLEANAMDLKRSISEEMMAGRLTSSDAAYISKAVVRTLRWLKCGGGVTASYDELIQYQSELLQVSSPLFRAKSILCLQPNVVIPLGFSDPATQNMAFQKLLAIERSFSQDIEEELSQRTDSKPSSGSENGSSCSTISLDDSLNIMKEILGEEISDIASNVEIEGEIIDGDMLLQQIEPAKNSVKSDDVIGVIIDDVSTLGKQLDDILEDGSS